MAKLLDVSDFIVQVAAGEECAGKYVMLIIKQYTVRKFRQSLQHHVDEGIENRM